MKTTTVLAIALGIGALAACKQSPNEQAADNIEANAENTADTIEANADAMTDNMEANSAFRILGCEAQRPDSCDR